MLGDVTSVRVRVRFRVFEARSRTHRAGSPLPSGFRASRTNYHDSAFLTLTLFLWLRNRVSNRVTLFLWLRNRVRASDLKSFSSFSSFHSLIVPDWLEYYSFWF